MAHMKKQLCMVLSLCMLGLATGVASAAEQGPTTPRFRIEYATYIGGTGAEELREVIPFDDGSALVGGQTSSPDLPVTRGVVQPTYGGELHGTGHPGVVGGDCFLVRLSPDGSEVLACTYFGGSKQERNVYGMGLDAKGNVVISSATRSPDLPTTSGCFRPRYSGPPHDGFAAKLTPDLKGLLWCTYLGGCWPRGGLGLDAQDTVYVVGGTESADFPTTSGVVRRRVEGPRDAIVLRLSSDGSRAVWSTLLGGGDWDGLMGVRMDSSGSVHVAGHTRSTDLPVTEGAPQQRAGGQSDCFLAGLSPDASRLLYATYLGGAGNEFAEHRPCLDSDGSVLLTGVTASSDFPVTGNALQGRLKGETDGFLTRLSPDGKRLLFSTYLGGSGGEFFLMPTPDPDGNIFIVGHTSSPDFPATADAVQKEFGGGPGDGALALISADGSRLLFATYLGGSGDDLIRSIALGHDGALYLVGRTSSKDFPVTAGSAQTTFAGASDAFVVKLAPAR